MRLRLIVTACGPPVGACSWGKSTYFMFPSRIVILVHPLGTSGFVIPYKPEYSYSYTPMTLDSPSFSASSCVIIVVMVGSDQTCLILRSLRRHQMI